MNKIIDKRITMALRKYVSDVVGYKWVAYSAKWDSSTAELLYDWVHQWKKKMVNIPLEMSGDKYADMVEKIKKAKKDFRPVVKTITAINNRRFNFDKVIERGTYDKYGLTMQYDEETSLYTIVFASIGTTLVANRNGITDINIDFDKI